jgi:hypothetical protein
MPETLDLDEGMHDETRRSRSLYDEVEVSNSDDQVAPSHSSLSVEEPSDSDDHMGTASHEEEDVPSSHSSISCESFHPVPRKEANHVRWTTETVKTTEQGQEGMTTSTIVEPAFPHDQECPQGDFLSPMSKLLVRSCNPAYNNEVLAYQIDRHLARMPSLPMTRRVLRRHRITSRYNPASDRSHPSMLLFLKDVEREALYKGYTFPDFIAFIQRGDWIACPLRQACYRALLHASDEAFYHITSQRPSTLAESSELYGQLLLWFCICVDKGRFDPQYSIHAINNFNLEAPRLSSIAPYVAGLINMYDQLLLPGMPEDHFILDIKMRTEQQIMTTFPWPKSAITAKQILGAINKSIVKINQRHEDATSSEAQSSKLYSPTLSPYARRLLEQYDKRTTLSPTLRRNANTFYLVAVREAIAELLHSMPELDQPFSASSEGTYKEEDDSGSVTSYATDDEEVVQDQQA